MAAAFLNSETYESLSFLKINTSQKLLLLSISKKFQLYTKKREIFRNSVENEGIECYDIYADVRRKK